jgi:predicted RNase H-like HicB family nuclease
MNSTTPKELSYYLALNYEMVIRKMTRSESGSDEPRYLVQIPLIDGVMAEGQTPQEALASLEDVKRLAFELMLKQGKEIPEPALEPDMEIAA